MNKPLYRFEVRVLEDFCRRHEANDVKYRRAVKALMDNEALPNKELVAHNLALADADCPSDRTVKIVEGEPYE